MAVPTLITDLSTTPASNSPAGSENVFPNLDDYLRVQSAFLASIRDNSGNGWVSPYLATGTLAAPPAIGSTTPNAISGTTGSFSGDVQMPSQNGSALAGLRNRLINAGMQIQQRGSISVTASTAYGPDRWLVQIASATGISATSNIAALTGSPSGFGSYITGTWTLGRPYWAQRIESKNVRDFVNKQVTVSGYINMPSGVNDTLDVRLQYATATDNFTSTTLIATNTTTSITGGSAVFFSTTFSSATMNVANIANGLEVAIFKTTNVTHGTSASYVLSCVQLEIGISTPFEQRPYGMELALCQRYYEKSYDMSFAPGSITALGAVTWNCNTFSATAYPRVAVSYAVNKRTTPGVTLYNTATGSSAAGTCVRNNDASTDVLGSAAVIGERGFTVQQALTTLTSGNWMLTHYVASAEL